MSAGRAPRHPGLTGIRPEAPGDAAAVRRVLREAFAPSAGEAGLVDALRGGGHLVGDLTLVAVHGGEVAVHGGEVAGYAAVSRARLTGGHEVLVLAPVAVSPPLQGRGVGSGLVREVLARAAAAPQPLMTVLGDPAFYGRFGFLPAEPLGVESPFPVPPGAWMAFPLPAHTANARGTVVYAEPFGAVSPPG